MNSVHDNFGHALRVALIRRYKKIPSAARIARDFNLRCDSGFPVSDETARRWMRGLSIPDAARLITFARWLDIDFNAIFGQSERAFPIGHSDHTSRSSCEVPQKSALNPELYERISSLDDMSQALLLKLLSGSDSVFNQ